MFSSEIYSKLCLDAGAMEKNRRLNMHVSEIIYSAEDPREY